MTLEASDDDLDEVINIKCVMCNRKIPDDEGYWCSAAKCKTRCHKQQQCSGHTPEMASLPWFCRGTCYHNHCANRTDKVQGRKTSANADYLYVATVDAQGDLLHQRYQLWNLLRCENFDVLVVTNANIHTSSYDDNSAVLDSDTERKPLKGPRWRYYDYAHYDMWHTRPSTVGGVIMYVRRRLEPVLVAAENAGAFDLIVAKQKLSEVYFIGLNRRSNFGNGGPECLAKLTRRLEKILKLNKKPKRNQEPPPPPTLIITGNVNCDYWKSRPMFAELETKLNVKQNVLVSNWDIPMIPGNQMIYATRRHRADILSDPCEPDGSIVGQCARDAFDANFNQICDQFDCLAPELSKRELSKLGYGQTQAMHLGFKLALAYFARHAPCKSVLFTSIEGIGASTCGLDLGLDASNECAPKLVWSMVSTGSSGQTPTKCVDVYQENDSTHDTLSKYHGGTSTVPPPPPPSHHQSHSVEYSEVRTTARSPRPPSTVESVQHQEDTTYADHRTSAMSASMTTSQTSKTYNINTSYTQQQHQEPQQQQQEQQQHQEPQQQQQEPQQHHHEYQPTVTSPRDSTQSEFELKQQFLHGHPPAPPPPPPVEVDPRRSPIISKMADDQHADDEFNAIMGEDDDAIGQEECGNEYMSLIRQEDLALQGQGSEPGSMIVHEQQEEATTPTGKPVAYV